MTEKLRMICIGASAGGIQAVQKVLFDMRSRTDVPIVVVQHISRSHEIDLELIFGRFYSGEIMEPGDKDAITPGKVYFAPSGYHLLMERDWTFSLSQEDPVNYSRPSIDVFMESAAEIVGAGLCGILLTGANSDGALGIKSIHECGGVTIVQDPDTAESNAMPQSALDIMKPDYILPLNGIGEQIVKLSEGSLL